MLIIKFYFFLQVLLFLVLFHQVVSEQVVKLTAILQAVVPRQFAEILEQGLDVRNVIFHFAAVGTKKLNFSR